MKLTTQQKLDAITAIATPHYEDNYSHDDICGKVFGQLPDGIAFGEISALVKQCGIDGGFVVKLEARKENALLDIDKTECSDYNFEQITALIAEIATAHDVAINWTTNKMKAHFTDADVDFPRKSTLAKWQLAWVGLFDNESDPTDQQLIDAIDGLVASPRAYVTKYGEFARQLTAI